LVGRRERKVIGTESAAPNDVKAWLLQHGAGGEANPIVAGSRGDDPFWKYAVGPAGRSKKRHLDRRIGGAPFGAAFFSAARSIPFESRIQNIASRPPVVSRPTES
jgi:hypothetical protein